MNTLLIIILVLILVGGLPATGLHSFGYGPSGLAGVLLLVLIVLLLTGQI